MSTTELERPLSREGQQPHQIGALLEQLTNPNPTLTDQAHEDLFEWQLPIEVEEKALALASVIESQKNVNTKKEKKKHEKLLSHAENDFFGRGGPKDCIRRFGGELLALCIIAASSPDTEDHEAALMAVKYLDAGDEDGGHVEGEGLVRYSRASFRDLSLAVGELQTSQAPHRLLESRRAVFCAAMKISITESFQLDFDLFEEALSTAELGIEEQWRLTYYAKQQSSIFRRTLP